MSASAATFPLPVVVMGTQDLAPQWVGERGEEQERTLVERANAHSHEEASKDLRQHNLQHPQQVPRSRRRTPTKGSAKYCCRPRYVGSLMWGASSSPSGRCRLAHRGSMPQTPRRRPPSARCGQKATAVAKATSPATAVRVCDCSHRLPATSVGLNKC